MKDFKIVLLILGWIFLAMSFCNPNMNFLAALALICFITLLLIQN